MYAKLQYDGYILCRNAIEISKTSKTLIKTIDELQLDMNVIFKRGKDEKRFQAKIPMGDEKGAENNYLSYLVSQVISCMQPKFPKHKFVSSVVLKSLPGCEVQPAHSDYQPDENVQIPKRTGKNYVQQLSGLQRDNKRVTSFGLILAIMPNTTFTIWPGLTNRNLTLTKDNRGVLPMKIRLNVGDILLFTGEQIHAGSEYSELNYRIHLYVDGNFNKMQGQNITWIVDKMAPQPHRCIELLEYKPENDLKNYTGVLSEDISLVDMDENRSIHQPEFFELDSLSASEKSNMIKQGGIKYFATLNLDPKQGSNYPYKAPHLYTKRCDFTDSTKAIWYKFHYYRFDAQNTRIQEKLNQRPLSYGNLLFWVLEINPKTNKTWSSKIQLPVRNHILPLDFESSIF